MYLFYIEHFLNILAKVVQTLDKASLAAKDWNIALKKQISMKIFYGSVKVKKKKK